MVKCLNYNGNNDECRQCMYECLWQNKKCCKTLSSLKPCAFCGGEGYYRAPQRKGCEDIMIIECKQCGASPYAVFVSCVLDDDEKKAAIAEKWNRRANG